MKICVITPISHLQVFGSLGEMDMSLSHLIVEEPTGPYARYYQDQRKKGRFVILDNSAFELEQQGKGLDPDPVLDAAAVTNPSEVIATDVLFDGSATIESTKRFIERMRERKVLGKYQVMGVVQGRTEKEWFECLDQLKNIPEITTIGLSKLSVPMSFLGEKVSDGCVARSRLLCTDAIERHCFYVGKQFHLLGGDNWTPWEIKQQTQHPWIRSNDSSCAVWYGAHGSVFNEMGVIEEIMLEKPDLENRYHCTRVSLDMPYNRACIMENIARWLLASKGE